MSDRLIKNHICRSSTINKLTDAEEAMFYRLLVNCDDYGRADARLAIVKADLYPLREISHAELEARLRALEDAGLIYRYVVDDAPYLQVVTWQKHQKIRNQKSRFPSPEEGEPLRRPDPDPEPMETPEPEEKAPEDGADEHPEQAEKPASEDKNEASENNCGQLRTIADNCGQLRLARAESNPIRIQYESESESGGGGGARARTREDEPPAASPPEIGLTDEEVREAARIRAADDQAEDLISRYGLARNMASLDAVVSDIRTYGFERVESAFREAASSDRMGGLSLRFVRAFLADKPKGRTGSGPGKADYTRHSEEERHRTAGAAAVDLDGWEEMG